MAYKLTLEEKEKANFIRSFNKNVENAVKTFGKSSEVYMNLVSFANIHGMSASKSNMGFFQASSSKSVMATLNISEIKEAYYKGNGQTSVIKEPYNTASKKAVASRRIKKSGYTETYKSIQKTIENTNMVVENYKEAKETATPREYDKMLKIMQHFRDNTMSSDEYDYLNTIANAPREIIGGNIIDKETGEVIFSTKSKKRIIITPDMI